jgi:hypothetical protein
MRPSFGRIQPYTAAKTQIQQQTGPGGTPNTFYAPNNSATPANPYNWLTHLDRQLVSPMELLNVSAFKPHEMTQQFNAQMYAAQTPIPAAPTPGVTPSYYGYRAPWFDEDVPPGTGNSHFLYRLFEFLETGSRMTGMAPGGRIPGKVNINTIYDQEIPQALAAAQPQGNPSPNYFDQASVQNIFNQLMTLRSPGLSLMPGADGQIHAPANSGIPPSPGQTPDQPFLSLAAGLSGVGGPPDTQYPAGLSINNTLMWRAAGPPPQGLFQVTSFGPGASTAVNHPYLQDQLFAKIFNNLTTRSNVFVVWLTVGFFEVTNSNTRPVQLGAEIGKAENRQVRHRMFAIIDRTSLATEANNPSQLSSPPVFVNGTSYGTPNPSPFFPPAPFAPVVPLSPAATTMVMANPTWPCISLPGAGGTPGDPSGIPASTLGGRYDGIRWSIQAYQPAGAGNAIMGTNLLIDMGASQELVNVIGIDQPGVAPGAPPASPRVFLNGGTMALAHTGPLSVTPVNTISAYTAIPPGSGPVAVSVNAVSGTFQGTQWSLQATSGTQPGTMVLIDVGPAKETAIVQSITPPASAGQPYTVVLQAANPTGMFNSTGHTPGSLGAYTISYPIPVLGNPGPQPNLNVRQVPWVVRYLSIIN